MNQLQRLQRDTLANCKHVVKGKTLYTTCEIPTLGGTVKLIFSEELRPIERKLMHELQNRASVEGVGWGWSNIKKTFRKVKKVAKKVASKKTLKKINKFLNDPRVSAAMNAVAMAYPPAGKAFDTIKTASNVVNGAINGSPEAIAQVSAIKDAAMEGNPKAAEVIKAMTKIYSLKKVSVAKQAKGLLDKVTAGDAKSKQNFLHIADLALNGNKLAANIVELMRGMYGVQKSKGTVSGHDVVRISGCRDPEIGAMFQDAIDLDLNVILSKTGHALGGSILRKQANFRLLAA